VFLVVEAAHRIASRRGFPAGGGGGAPDVVLVLGCPSRRDGSLHPLQRWRTEIAVRTAPAARLVFSGFAGDHGRSEAAVMAEHARDDLAVPPDRIVLETAARNTWENVELTLGELQQGGRVAIASSPLHALRARRYLLRQRPDLALRLVPAADYRFGERWRWKALTLLYDVLRSVSFRLRIDRADETSDVR
jgi:uncharacterized SAM-binding protein YcdF (DUF218 family)